MSVRKVTTEDIPDDVQKFSAHDALHMQWELVETWKPQYQVWPLKYGGCVCGLATFISGLTINNFFRVQLRMRTYARFISILASTAFPTVFSGVLHQSFITNDILLIKTGCMTCTSIRSTLLQTAAGFASSVILAPLMCLHFADAYKTYAIPSFVSERAEAVQFFKYMGFKLRRKLGVLLCMQIAVGFSVAQAEGFSFNLMQERFLKFEEAMKQHRR